MNAPPPNQQRRVNIRTEDGLQRVEVEVISHYRSELVEQLRRTGGLLTVGNTTIRLAKEFGFCYGVERAIDLAYAARQVFADRKLYLLGEIIHNPEVNRQLDAMGIISIPMEEQEKTISALSPQDVVIVPAFGAETRLMNIIKERGCLVVDTTCGDVMNVWKRVRSYAKQAFTSIIHGKSSHEETRATASRALGDQGNGHFLVVLTLDDVEYVCHYITHGGNREEFLARFNGESVSEGFDPDVHLQRVGVANQTTMLKSETEEIQRRVRQAILERDGEDLALKNFQVFDTICGATQERQDSLFDMLEKPMDVLMVVGGYNSSNTAHLVEIGEKELPTFFIRTAECLKSFTEIIHFDLHQKAEKTSYSEKLASPNPIIVGITAGASCPNNLIEETILRIFELRGIAPEQVQQEAAKAAA
jgi:4-hydroxy-3-methylbut-2-enyl diphosphate reductase